jgi:hypothetical protein
MIRRLLCALLGHQWGPHLPWIIYHSVWRSCYRCGKKQLDWAETRGHYDQ